MLDDGRLDGTGLGQVISLTEINRTFKTSRSAGTSPFYILWQDTPVGYVFKLASIRTRRFHGKFRPLIKQSSDLRDLGDPESIRCHHPTHASARSRHFTLRYTHISDDDDNDEFNERSQDLFFNWQKNYILQFILHISIPIISLMMRLDR